MSLPFPHANIVAGILILIVGFVFHWIGQLISVVNWDLATRLGLQEKAMLPEYKVYEHGVAVADFMLAWTYGLTAAGLFADAAWAYHLSWIPGSIMVYHSICAWAWEGNRRKAGHQLWSNGMRLGWCAANLIAGGMALLIAWSASAGV